MSDQDNQSQLHAMRHSLAHILASAVLQLHPGAKFGVGPVTENGFYYDIDLAEPISSTDLGNLEHKMRVIIDGDIGFEQEDWPIDQAIEYFSEHSQPYKVELLQDLQKYGTTKLSELTPSDLGVSSATSTVDTVSIYRLGDFVDLCRGPHLSSSGEVGVFKLTKVSGAYWRGNEKNPQMQRIYGVAFASQTELDDYTVRQEEALRRDHRKLGRELDLFTFSDLVGAGLPLYTPRGTQVLRLLQQALMSVNEKYGAQPVSIPYLAKLDLYQKSGHAEKFAGELFQVKSHYNQDFVLKPVNCPHHTQIYASRPRSYRDLPIRMVEMTGQYRDEKPGEIGGLQRTRGFTVDDGHIFCRIDQIKDEASLIIQAIKEFYEGLGLWGQHWVSLSVRDANDRSGYIGEDADWAEAERMLAELSDEFSLEAKRMEGEAAIYGPKLDFMFKDALGRETQLATIQLDFAMPKRFELVYTDSDGNTKTPVMIHRAILGSFERFMMLIIEHFAGAFPVWLAPEQVRVVPVSDKVSDYADDFCAKLRAVGVRVEIGNDNNSLGKRIRVAELMKVPYVIVVGEKEVADNLVAVRRFGEGDLGTMRQADFIDKLTNEIATRSIK